MVEKIFLEKIHF